MDEPSPKDRYATLARIFERASALAAEERAAFLREACGKDDGLLAEAKELLGHSSDESGAFSERSVFAQRAQLEGLLERQERNGATSSPWLPELIGAYRILGVVGRGGMGVVYEAEQDSPRRRVALKLVDPLFATDETLRRFRDEVELLGRMQHPGVVQIFEAGTFDVGAGEQPYFAMEYVDGLSLLDYVHSTQLDRRARIEVILRILDAAQYAHSRGVVHGDLKPENILVDDRGQPKLLDFGVARLVDGSDAARTVVSAEGRLVGTLAYMSPEQAAGRPSALSPASDQFAVGVVMFRLLAGALPRDLDGLPLTAALRVVTNEETRRIEAVVSDIERDLAIIVGKTLELEPKDRYATLGALGADLRAFLEHRPITARPPSRVDSARKYVRRHRTLVVSFAAVVAVLLLGVLATSLYARDAERARRETRRTLYSAEMLLACEAAFAAGGLERVKELTQRWLPAAGEEDLRGWEWRLLDHLARDACRVIPLGAPVHTLALHPDGRRVAAASSGAVHFLDITSNEAPIVWDVPPELGSVHLTGLDWSPDGESLVIAGDGVLAVLEAATRELVWSTSWSHAHSPRWHTRGALIVASIAGVGIVGFDAATGANEVFDADAIAPIPALEFDPRGEHLVALSSTRRTIYEVHELQLGPPRPFDVGPEVSTHDWVSVAFAWSPVAETVAVADLGGRLTAFEPTTLELVAREVDHQEALRDVVWSPDGALLAIASDDSSVRIYDAHGGGRIRWLQGHTAMVTALGWTSGGRHIVSASVDGSVRVWDVSVPSAYRRAPHPRRPLSTLAGNEPRLSFGASDEQLLVYTDGSSSLWDLGSMTRRDLGVSLVGGVLSPDGQRIVIGRNRIESIEVLSASTGARVGSFPTGPDGAEFIAWHLDGERFARASLNGVDIYDLREGTQSGLRACQHVCLSISFAPDGARLAFAEGHLPVRIVNVPDGGAVQRDDSETSDIVLVSPHGARCYAIAWSPDGNRIALGYDDKRIGVFDCRSGHLEYQLEGHNHSLTSLAWHPDGEVLASASKDGTVKLWSTRRRALTGSLRCGQLVGAVAWAPSGRLLAAHDSTGAVHLWSIGDPQ